VLSYNDASKDENTFSQYACEYSSAYTLLILVFLSSSQVLEQEKYQLRRKLDAAFTDYEIRVSELQADISELQKSLEEQQRLMKQADREHSMITNELTEQNQRLTAQLKEANRKEESLTCQLQAMRDQFSLRKMAMSDHTNHLENLRDEVG
jgi:chromosome segregation ATPase